MSIINLENLLELESFEHLEIYYQNNTSYLIVSDKSPMFCFEGRSIEDCIVKALKAYISYVDLMKKPNEK